jgi:hypothetical protein
VLSVNASVGGSADVTPEAVLAARFGGYCLPYFSRLLNKSGISGINWCRNSYKVTLGLKGFGGWDWFPRRSCLGYSLEKPELKGLEAMIASHTQTLSSVEISAKRLLD